MALKNTILLSLALICITRSASSQAPPRLIVRGDDMGFSHAGNLALIKCHNEGIETSIEVIVPSPWFPEAVKLLKENPGVDVGVHIALTSEWDNVKYRPVSFCPSLTNADGYFFPFIWPNKRYPGQALMENSWSIADVEKEIRAQIELAKKRLPEVSHISAHMGCYNLSPEVRTLTKKLAAEYDLDIDPGDYNVESVSYAGPKATSAEKLKSFTAMLESLSPGKTYLFVDHPGLNTPELQAIHHLGYENVATDRQGVTDTWTNTQIMDLINKLGIQLISYRDLRDVKR